MNSKRIACSMIAVSVATLAGGVAGAQEAQPAASAEVVPARDEGGLEDIVVTARKRSESVNDVPISVTALGAAALQSRGVASTEDLVRVVPGLNFAKSNYGTPIYTLRGIGFNDVSLGASPAVSVYVDEVPLPFSIMTRGASLDLERVEVLKGPQGTLFGQNSTGGAINYIAAKPTQTFQAGGSVSYGSFNRFDGEAFISGPLGDKIVARLAVRTEQGGAWQRSYTRDAELGDAERYIGRLLVEIRPTDGWTLVVNANGWIDRSETQAGQLILVNGSPARTPAVIRNYPLAPHTARAADWDPVPGLNRDDKFYQLSVRSELAVADRISLVAIGAYQHLKAYGANDVDGTSFEDFLGTQFGTLSSSYGELRLAGSGPFEWVVGGAYQRDLPKDRLATSARRSSFPFTGNITYNDQRVTTYAAFADLTAEVLPGLKLQGGLRYTSQKRSFSGCTADSGDGSYGGFQASVASAANGRPITIARGGCATLDNTTSLPVRVTNNLNEDNLSWRGGISYALNRETLLYANVSRGYKSGSFPTLGTTRSSQFTAVTQESVLAYEAGVKATLFDRKVQANAAVFYYDYNDKQVRGKLPDPVLGPLNALVNIPKSRVAGAEVQLDWSPVNGLRLSSGGTYVDSKILRNFTNFGPFGALQNFGGEALPLTPKWQINGDAEYHFPLNDSLFGVLGASAAHQSKTFALFGELPITAIDAYTTVDLRAGIESERGKWRLTAWVRNLGNKYYWNNVFTVLDTTVRYSGMPRTVGVTFSIR